MIFAKAPVLGTVKTRLQLPETVAKELHEAFVKDVVHGSQGPWRQTLWVTDTSHDFFNAHTSSVHQQEGPDLGARLYHAFEKMLETHGRVVVIGTDAPHMPVSAIHEAFDALLHTDAVIGPCEDGGYYLLGLNRTIPELFRPEIGWGGSDVFSQSMKAFEKRGIKPKVLSTLFDIDRPEDLERLSDLPQTEGLVASRRVLRRLGLGGLGERE